MIGEEEHIERNFQNIEEISQHLKCTVCQEVFDNPHRIKCGHTYCLVCIQNWKKRQSSCPNCRVKFEDNTISKDLIAFNIINDLVVLCNNRYCPWHGVLGDLNHHLKVCFQDEKQMSEFLRLNKNMKKNKDNLNEKNDKKINDNELLLANQRAGESQEKMGSLFKVLESKNPELRSNQGGNIVKQGIVSKANFKITKPVEIASNGSNGSIAINHSIQINKLPVTNNLQVPVSKVNLNNISNNLIAANSFKPVPKLPSLSLNNNVYPQVVNIAAVNILKIVNNANTNVNNNVRTNNVITAQPPTSTNNNIVKNEDQSAEANANRHTAEDLYQMQLEYAIKMSEDTYNKEKLLRSQKEEDGKKLEANLVIIILFNLNRAIKDYILYQTFRMLQ